MKKSLQEQISGLQKKEKLPVYVKRKRNFPFVTQEQIERGAILYVPLSADEGLTLRKYSSKDKWIVVIGISEEDCIVGSLLVNTKPNLLPEELGAVQFPLAVKDYPFLDYKSWLDCSEIFRVPRSKILSRGGYCGKISERDFELIWNTIKETEFISDEDKETFGIV